MRNPPDASVLADERCDRVIVVETKYRKALGSCGRQCRSAVGRDPQDVRVARVKERLADGGAPHLELRDAGRLESFNQSQIAGGEPSEDFFDRHFRSAAQFVNQSPPRGGAYQHLAATGEPMAERILAGVGELKAVMGVLPERHDEPASAEARDHLLDDRRLAASRPACES